MSKKRLFFALMCAAVFGLIVGGVLALATSDVPTATARALAMEKYSGGIIVEEYLLPSEVKILNPRVFLICGTADSLLHRVKVSGTATTPLVADMGSVNGVFCSK